MKPFLITFREPTADYIRFHRTVPAPSPTAAVITALQALRPGALQRYAARKYAVAAYVADPDHPRHPNGSPIIVSRFAVQFKIDSTTVIDHPMKARPA